MDDVPMDFRLFAGRVVFPRSIADLASSSVCPSCQVPLTSSIECASCLLDIRNPAAVDLASLSAEIVTLFDQRLDVIGRIRWDSAQTAAAEFESAVAEPAPKATTLISVNPAVAFPVVETALPVVSSEPRRSSVQVALLVVGISLLSVAAIFFLIYAFITYGLLARSLIVGGITIASVVTATTMHRRSLAATAEGISVFALVLVYLDAWALQANNFFGLGSGDSSFYWGWVLIITAALFVAWARLSSLRAPSIVAFLVFPIGFGLLVGVGFEGTDRTFVTYAAIACAGLLYRFAGRSIRSEAVISWIMTTVALFIAMGYSFGFAPEARLGASGALGIIALVALVAVIAVDWRRNEDGTVASGSPRLVGAVFASIAGVSAAAAFGAAALRSADSTLVTLVPSIAATVVALLLEALISRGRTSSTILHLRVASISAAVIAALALLFPIGILMLSTGDAIVRGLDHSWSLAGGSRIVSTSPEQITAAIALATVVAVIALCWAIRHLARRRLGMLAWAGAAGVLIIAPIAEILWVVLVTWLLLAALALIALIRLPSVPRAPLALVAFGGSALAYAAGWASEDTWAVTSVVVISIVLAARLVFASQTVRATMLGIAVTLAIIGAAAGARNLALSFHPELLADGINAARATGFIAILLLALAALVPSPRVSTLDRRVTFWLTTGTVVVSLLFTQFSLDALSAHSVAGLLLPEYSTGLVVGVFLVVALISWLFSPLVRDRKIERATVAMLLAPALAFVVDALLRVLLVEPGPPQLALAIGAAVTAALSLVVAANHPSRVKRIAIDAGITIVAIPAVIGAIIVPSTLTWLVFEIAATAAFLIAIGEGGLVHSRSRRRGIAWLGLALSATGLWWWLNSEQIAAIEPWVLPVTGALLLAALLAWLSGRTLTPPTPGSAPWIMLAALLVSIVPLALQLSLGNEIRPIIVGAVSALLLLVGAIINSPRNASHRAEPFVHAAAAAGWVGVVLVSAVQAMNVLSDGTRDGRLDLWVGSAFIVLLAASLILVRSHRASRLPVVASEALAFTALLMLVALMPAGMAPDDRGFLRALVVFLIFGAAHVVALVARRAPFTSRIGWTSIGFAVIVGIVALSTGAFDNVEWFSIPIGLALLVSGATQMRWVPESSSWPWLAPGVLALLVPSLIATATDPALWRLVGIGTACVLLITASSILKLQAPFVLASVVVLIHATATFSPAIANVYQAVEWWVWLALGGIVIVAVSVRFEKSRQGIKRVIGSIAGLR